jgi:hypothetical protein
VETDARGDPSRVRVDGLGRARKRDCFITQTIARHVAVGSPFVSNSSESVAQFEHGDFKFESPEYQWRELVVKEKPRCEAVFLGEKP